MMRKGIKRIATVTLVFALALTLVSCGKKTPENIPWRELDPKTDETHYVPPADEIPPTPESSDPEPIVYEYDDLVEYNGVVEHLFFHTAIAYPELAFRGDSREKGFDDYMITVYEYNLMLQSLYDKNYILVDMNDVWSEYTDENGAQRMKKNTLMIPKGKKPLILSYDDISYYEYMTGYGFMRRLIVGEDGEIWAEGVDDNGNAIVTQDLDAVTLLDKFVEEHPDFSLYGAKGCFALTGYEGILGYRTNTDRDDTSPEFEANRQREIERVKPVIAKLKETGWYFASHSWGHINLNKASLDSVKDDAQRWMNEVGSLVGKTNLFIYPFGSRLDGGDVYETGPALQYYVDLGFRVFASVGIESFSRVKPDICAVVCDRMHADGVTLRYERDRYMLFYDAKEVFDPARKEEYGNSWG